MVIHHTVFVSLIRSRLCLIVELCHHLYFRVSVFSSSADGMTKQPLCFSLCPGRLVDRRCLARSLVSLWQLAAHGWCHRHWINPIMWSKTLLILCLPAMWGLAPPFRQCVQTQTALCDVTESTDSVTTSAHELCPSAPLCFHIVPLFFQKMISRDVAKQTTQSDVYCTSMVLKRNFKKRNFIDPKVRKCTYRSKKDKKKSCTVKEDQELC